MRAQARKIDSNIKRTAKNRGAVGNVRPKPESGLKRGPVFAGVFCCLAILLTAANLQEIANFINRPVTKVKLENQWSKLSEREVSQLLAPYMGSGFFAFDVVQLKSDIERHPWVKQAAVQRVWPDSVSLRIDEKVAIARWGENQLLSQQGDRFSPAQMGNAASLPRLSGPEGSQQRVMEQYQFLNELFSPVDLRLSELRLSERGSWELVVNDRIAIAAGREKIIERVNRFISFYQQESDFDRLAIVSVDLRYDNGLAIALNGEEPSGVAIR